MTVLPVRTVAVDTEQYVPTSKVTDYCFFIINITNTTQSFTATCDRSAHFMYFIRILLLSITAVL